MLPEFASHCGNRCPRDLALVHFRGVVGWLRGRGFVLDAGQRIFVGLLRE
jgi:hypothetical protein